MSRVKLVLDFDNTLIVCHDSSTSRAMHRKPDCHLLHAGKVWCVYKRPFLEGFLRCCAQWFEIVIWTAGLASYAESAVPLVYPTDLPKPSVYTRDHCTFMDNVPPKGSGFVKDLRKLEGFPDRVFLLDDQPRSFHLTPENGLQIPRFDGDDGDCFLMRILPYLWTLHRFGFVWQPVIRDWQTLARAVLQIYRAQFLAACGTDWLMRHGLWFLLDFDGVLPTHLPTP